MLFADHDYTCTAHLLHLVAIRGLERPKNTDVTELELVRSMRWQSAQDDLVFKAKLHHFQ